MKLFKHNGDPTKATVDLVTEAVALKKQIAALENQLKGVQSTLLTQMATEDVKTLEIPELASITFVAETVRKSFDSTKFKEDHPKLFEQYQKESSVKSSLRIKEL